MEAKMRRYNKQWTFPVGSALETVGLTCPSLASRLRAAKGPEINHGLMDGLETAPLIDLPFHNGKPGLLRTRTPPIARLQECLMDLRKDKSAGTVEHVLATPSAAGRPPARRWTRRDRRIFVRNE